MLEAYLKEKERKIKIIISINAKTKHCKCYQEIEIEKWIKFDQLFDQHKSHRHTYIHNWPVQPFKTDYYLASHTTYAKCVNCIHEWQDCGRTYSLK